MAERSTDQSRVAMPLLGSKVTVVLKLVMLVPDMLLLDPCQMSA